MNRFFALLPATVLLASLLVPGPALALVSVDPQTLQPTSQGPSSDQPDARPDAGQDDGQGQGGGDASGKGAVSQPAPTPPGGVRAIIKK